MSWRTERVRSENSTSSGYSSAPTTSGGLYRNMPRGEPAASPPRTWEARLSRSKRIMAPEDRTTEPVAVRPSRVVKESGGVREYLPCYVKPLRSVLHTDEEFEVRLDDISEREVWIRPIGTPSQELRDALENAELLPLKKCKRAYPVLVVSACNQRKRGLLLAEDEEPNEYLDVDTGRVEKVRDDQVFATPPALLSIPNAAIRCRFNRQDEQLKSKLLKAREILCDWTRSKVHVVTWGIIPVVTLSILEPNFDLKPVIAPRRVVRERKVQKLYRALPGILVPAPFTMLRNCSVLHVDDNYAYIVQNHAPFEIDPAEAAADLTVIPSIREMEQLFIEGDVVRATSNNHEVRVIIEKDRTSSFFVRSVDSGVVSEVNDLRELRPLLKREPPGALKVALPAAYYRMRPEELSVFLRTGVFDVFFEDNDEIPAVRLFTLHGLEMNICLADKIECESTDFDSDDTNSTRSSRG